MPEFRESNDAQSMYDLIRTALDKTYSFSARKFEHECAFEHASLHPPAVKQPHSVALSIAEPDARASRLDGEGSVANRDTR